MADSQNSSSDDATDSFLGYLYQLRFALLGGLALRDARESVAIELLDDVQFATSDGSHVKLHQLKHSITKKASLGPRSENLWKTIGNWSIKIAKQEVDLNSTTFYLHSTGNVPKGSPLSYLKPRERDESKAHTMLIDAAQSSSSDAIKYYLRRLTNLSKKLQLALLEQIVVIDSAADIAEAATEIEHVLGVSSRPQDLQSHRQYLEGWFFDRTIRSLLETDSRLITAQEIRNQSITIRDQLVSDHLPLLALSDIPSDQLLASDRRVFVEQLRLINARAARIRRAQTEHFQALTHRSKWSRDGKVAIEELPKFDNRLITEWQIRHECACANCADAKEDIEVQEAERVYKWVEEEAPSASQLFIRHSFSEPFLIRGSYHILSNRLAVGWHPRYVEKLDGVNPGDEESQC